MPQPLPKDYTPEFESLKDLLLEMAHERDLDRLLSMIVHRFAERPHLAVARIWLVRPGDRCGSCAEAEGCFERSRCLHLVASAGRPAGAPDRDWGRLDGAMARLPLGRGIIGKIAASGEPHEVGDLRGRATGLDGVDWLEDEQVVGFSGEPLVHRGEVLGVLAVFVRIPIPRGTAGRGWLRLVADHAAAAIVNARAFDEIGVLKSRLERENAYLREEMREATAFEQLVGHSRAIEELRRQIDLAAPTDASVLILGETGTGKELVARELHRRSRRAGRPLIKVNCPSIPRELWESEFFGHVRGAFTGAIKDRVGRFELADEGTLFLDEVGEIPIELQSRLLRVIQEGELERVGDEATRRVDVRIIAATNLDLERAVAEERFRRDLFFRLGVFPIHVPPLREHRADIPELAAYFARRFGEQLNRTPLELGSDDLAALDAYDWPGNVRELRNLVERATITDRSASAELALFGTRAGGAPTPPVSSREPGGPVLTMAELKRRETENIRAALEQTRHRIYGPNGAAALLEMKPTTLASRIKKLGL